MKNLSLFYYFVYRLYASACYILPYPFFSIDSGGTNNSRQCHFLSCFTICPIVIETDTQIPFISCITYVCIYLLSTVLDCIQTGIHHFTWLKYDLTTVCLKWIVKHMYIGTFSFGRFLIVALLFFFFLTFIQSKSFTTCKNGFWLWALDKCTVLKTRNVDRVRAPSVFFQGFLCGGIWDGNYFILKLMR